MVDKRFQSLLDSGILLLVLFIGSVLVDMSSESFDIREAAIALAPDLKNLGFGATRMLSSAEWGGLKETCDVTEISVLLIATCKPRCGWCIWLKQILANDGDGIPTRVFGLETSRLGSSQCFCQKMKKCLTWIMKKKCLTSWWNLLSLVLRNKELTN